MQEVNNYMSNFINVVSLRIYIIHKLLTYGGIIIKTLRYFLYLILAIGIILGGAGIIFGTPWEKKQFYLEVHKYLQENFEEEMIIVSEPNFSFIDNRTYAVSVSPKNNREIIFAVGQNIHDKIELYDSFLYEYWTYVASLALNDDLSKLFSSNQISGKFVVNYNIPEFLKIHETKNNYPFEEIKDKLRGEVYIDIHDEFKDFYMESDKIMKIIELIKEKEYQIDYLSIDYENESERFSFFDYEIVNVQDAGDLLKYSKKNSSATKP